MRKILNLTDFLVPRMEVMMLGSVVVEGKAWGVCMLAPASAFWDESLSFSSFLMTTTANATETAIMAARANISTQ